MYTKLLIKLGGKKTARKLFLGGLISFFYDLGEVDKQLLEDLNDGLHIAKNTNQLLASMYLSKRIWPESVRIDILNELGLDSFNSINPSDTVMIRKVVKTIFSHADEEIVKEVIDNKYIPGLIKEAEELVGLILSHEHIYSGSKAAVV